MELKVINAIAQQGKDSNEVIDKCLLIYLFISTMVTIVTIDVIDNTE